MLPRLQQEPPHPSRRATFALVGSLQSCGERGRQSLAPFNFGSGGPF